MKSQIKVLLKKIFKIIKSLDDDDKNIRLELQRRAIVETADYIRSNLSNVKSTDSTKSVHEIAINNINIKSGIIIELGVHTGATINMISSKIRNYKIYGFDSFQGLPEDWRDGITKKTFDNIDIPKVNKNVVLHKGWFAETLPQFISSLPDKKIPIAYLHVDCDIYSSTKVAFESFRENIISGTVIVFDEYFNYDGWKSHEFKAFQEFVSSEKLKYKYLTYNYRGEQVAIKIL